jgi:hypothetical protein
MATPRRRFGNRARRVEHDAIVVNVSIALHHKAAGETKMIQQRNQTLDWRVGRSIAATCLVGKFVGRPENMEMRIPGAGRRRDARPFRLRYRPGNPRRLVGMFIIRA